MKYQNPKFNFTNFLNTGHLTDIVISEAILDPTENPNRVELRIALAELIEDIQSNARDFQSATRHALDLEVLSQNAQLVAISERAEVRVVNSRCNEAAEAYASLHKGHLALLNMASRKHLGGGGLSGGTEKGDFKQQGKFAQEESLIFSTDLAASLLLYCAANGAKISTTKFSDQKICYNKNTFEQTDTLYSSNKILRQLVGQTGFEWLHEVDQTRINIITSSAIENKSRKELSKINYNAFLAILYNQINTAIMQGNTGIILSAFGCGVFGNNPEVVAKLYREILSLPEFIGKMSVYFSVSNRGPNNNFNAFSEAFAAPLICKSPEEAEITRELVAKVISKKKMNYAAKFGGFFSCCDSHVSKSKNASSIKSTTEGNESEMSEDTMSHSRYSKSALSVTSS